MLIEKNNVIVDFECDEYIDYQQVQNVGLDTGDVPWVNVCLSPGGVMEKQTVRTVLMKTSVILVRSSVIINKGELQLHI